MAITFKVGFQVDDKELKSGLQGIQKDLENAFNVKSGNLTPELVKATEQAKILEQALKRATTDKGISYYSLTAELNKAGTSASKLTATLAAGGEQFAASLNAANTALATADRSVISLNSKIKEMSRVLTQSFKFTAAQTFLQGVSNAAQEAYQWVYDLNKTVTDISIVTGYQGDQLDRVTKNAIQGAKELRIAANDYAQGALIFYQQGLNDDEVARRTEITVKAARAAGQSMADMSSQLTAVWNTYKMTGDEMQRAASVGAKMAADTAVDFSDIAEAMQTAAAPAEQMGVTYNSLAAIIATVGDTTQQSASVIGNAFKTIFSRFQQLKSEGTDGEVTLNRVSSQLQELGVNVLDSSGELRQLDDVIMEVGNSWESWSSKQQLAIAQLVGGTRQYGQFLTLMNNFDKYQDLLGSANMEDGSTLEQQYESSLDSIESYAQNAAESMRRAFGQLFDEDMLKTAYSTIEGIGNIVGSIIQTLGGGVGVITQIAAALSSKVGPALANAAKNATTLAGSLTYEGRKGNINREYDANEQEYETRRKEATSPEEIESLNIQSRKNEFSRQTALINEKINTLLKTATGEEKIRLQIKQQNLKTAEDEYQVQLDQLRNLDKELQNEQKLLELQNKRKVNMAAQNVRDAAQNKQTAERNLQSANQELMSANQSVAARQQNKAAAGDKWTAEQEAQLVAALERQKKAIEAVTKAEAEQIVATEQLENAKKDLKEAMDTASGSAEQSLVKINQAFASYRSGATQGTDEVKQAIKNNANEIIQEYSKIADNFETAGLSDEAEEARAAIVKLKEAIDQVDNADDDALDDIIADLNTMGAQLPGVSEQVAQLIQANSDASMNVGQMQQRQSDAGAGLQEPPRSRLSNLGNRVASGLQTGIGKASNFLKSNEQIISGITQIGTSATAVISTVQGMWSVLGNPDASIMEKVTSVGTGIASMVPNIMNVVEGFSKLPPQVAIATIAIGATVAAVAALWNEFQKYTAEAKFERLSEAAKQLQADAEEARSKADALKSSIESYDSARAALDNCTKGTEEWKEALKATNDAAQDVINSISDLEGVDLSNLYERDENGMLMLNEDELERIQGETDKQASTKEYAAQMAEIQASQASNLVTAKNIASEHTGGAAGAIAGGAAVGAMYGSIAGPVGTAIGGIIGGLGGAILEDVQDEQIGEKIMENLDELTDLDTDDLRAKLQSFGMNVGNLSDTAIEQLRIQLQNLADSSAAAQEKLELIAGLAVDEQLGDQYSGEAKDIVSKSVAADQARLTDEWTAFMEDNFSKVSDGSEENRTTLVNAFNEAMGTNYTAAGNFSQGTDGNRVFAFRNEVTGEIETFTKEYIASTIAAQQALEGLEVSAQEAETMLKNLSVTGEDGKKDEGATQAVRDFISSGNLDSATKGDFETLKQGVEDAGGAQQYLESIGFTPEIAEQYAADFEAALEIDWDSVTAKLPESFKNAEELTLTQARGFGDTYQKIVGIAGEGAGKEYENMMSGILNGITDGDMQDQARDILAGIDWTQWDAAEQAAAALADIGIELDTSSESWQAFEASMRSTFKAVPDIKALAEEINNVKSISEGLELGSIISQEDYQTLVNFNSELGRYFTILADGTAKMTGDPLDFIQEVRSSEQEQLKEQIAAAQQMAEELQGVSGSQNYQGDNGENYYRGSNVQTQLDYIQAYGNVDQSQIDSWRADLEDGHSTVETINAIGAAFDELGMSAETAGNTAQTAMTQLAMTAGSAEERMEMLESGQINESAYGAAALSAINEEKWEGLDVEEVEDYSNHLQDLAGSSELVDSSLAENEETAEEVARAVMKTNDGVEKLSEGFEDWSDVIENSDEASEEYCDAMSGMKDALSDVLGVSEEFIDNDFIKKNMDDIAKAAEGDAEAIDNLRAALAEDLILDLTVDGSTAEQEALQAHADLTAKLAGKKVGFTVTADMDTTGILTAAQGVVDSAAMSVEEAQAYFNSLGYEPVFEMTEQTVQSKKPITETYTQDAGTTYETYETVNPDGTVSTQTVPFVRTRSFSKVVGYSTQDEVMQVPALSADGTPKITELKKINSGSLNNFSGSNAGGGSPGGGGSGGGGSAPKHQAKKAGKRDSLKVEDRYSTIQAAIDDVQRSLDKLDDTSSDMWGGPKLRALRKYNAELWEQAENYKELLDLTERYQEQDKKDADIARLEAGRKLGADLIGIQYNDDNYVANRTEIINQLDDLLQAAYDKYYNAAMAYDATESTSEAESERIDQLKEDYEELDAAVQEYIAALDLSDETAAKHEETLQSLVEMIRREISNRVEIITYRIELQTDVNDLQIQQLERSIEHLGDVGVLSGRKVGKLADAFRELNDNGNLAVQKFNELTSLLNHLNTAEGQSYFIEKFGQEAWNEYAETGVLPEEIISEMKSSIDEMISAVDDMYSKMEEMFDTYLELLDLYIEKFDQIADKLSRQNDKLDTYQQLLEFSGQQYNGRQGQQARKAIADARISTSQTNLQLSKAEFETYSEQYDEWMAQVEEFQRIHGDDIAAYDEATAAAWNKIDETRQELYNNMQEAEGEIYSNMQELVDNVAEAIEVGAQIIKEQVVESLDGLFNDFESMTETWDQMETLRLFFLEDYDKTYQLDSLLRDVNDAMEDVTDPERMNEYLALIDEINAAQADGVQMTQTDVDLLKAKFELQKAQDAYEQQMNAKTTMRLARDASGNWNYVYSDDQSNQEDAVQALADAQYNYDKLLHEARDESSQLWLQTQQEFFEWQEQIDQSRLQWDTAYREQIQRTYDYYLTLTDRYSNQVIKYNEMLGDNYADTTLGIITQYDTMEQAQADYTQQHAEYNEKLEENTKEYEQVVNDACDEIGIDYDDLANDVYDAANDIMRENDELKNDIWDLQGQASSALSAMSADVWSNVESMIAAIQALEAEIERAIALLEALTQAQLSSSSGGFDANRDYTATGYNAIAGMTEEEAKAFFETDRGQLMAQEWANKVNSELMKGHSFTIGGENYVYGDTATSQDFIDAMMEAVKQGTIEGNKYNEGDTSDVSNKVGDQGSHYNDIYGTPKTASGGLIRTPQIRSVAEDGAELILNNTDTQNILDAVKNMREVVKMKMSNINTNIDKKTEGTAQKTVINKDIQQVDQTVSIDATFPNVSVAAEIEEALNNLINQAVQYATRNNR